MHELIVENARLYPMTGSIEAADVSAFAVDAGRISVFEPDAAARQRYDAGGRIVMPGLIDCHTHALYAGHRMDEHRLRLEGASYEQIARAGGGILATVRAVRAADESELVAATLPRLAALAAEGVTSVEIKSGYGLDVATELKMLRAIRRCGEQSGLRVFPTFLGAHAVPPDTDREHYMRTVVEEMLPAVAGQSLASTVDIYVERIAFDLADLERLATAADALDLRLRAHTEQLSAMRASRRAAELGALSCDHVEYIDAEDATAMAAAGTVAVLLPGAFYFLREKQRPPVELLREHGVAMAVATDLNPGTSPVASLLTAMHMAATLFGLTPAEVLRGVTEHAARALGCADIGGLAPGMRADFTVWDLPAPEFLLYQMGGLRPDAVFIGGRRHG